MILFNNVPIPFGQFPNGEVNIPKPFFAKNWSDVRNVVTLKYESDQDLFRLFLVRKAIWFPCVLRITYFPYSRMDRNSDSYVFTLKSVAKYINMMEWEKVVIYEPHSDVTPALLNHCQVVDVTTSPLMFSKVQIKVGTDYQICYPDVGAFKRYSEKLKTGDSLVGFKRRDFATGKITSLEIFGERSKDTVVIVDDLCSKGGTFDLVSRHLQQMGFGQIVLVVAHCEKTIFEGLTLTESPINQIITTDSILDHNKGFSHLQIVPLTEFKW